jgi:cytoplasmic iron level regulating protein YaaA (DUF328/UPF0246 family)
METQMLVVISPAKKLDWSEQDLELSTPDFLSDASVLAETARGLSVEELKKLMKLSDALAQLNHDRFRAFTDTPAPEDLRPAVRAFAGDTYTGLEAASLDMDELDWAQEHLRILSGLYGLLRPKDGMQPYRLEMGSRLKNTRGKNLYAYWQSQIAEALNEQAQATGAKVLVNCASQEYFGAVPVDALGLPLVTPQFMEEKNGTPKIVSFYAKKARGAMARYIIQHRLTDPEALLDFDTGGYAYRDDLSTPDKPVFVREAVTAKKAA